MLIPTRCVLALALAAAACNGSDAAAGSPGERQSQDTGPDGHAQGSAPPAAASGFAQTKYPIVLAHGFIGFRRLIGVVDYFFGIPSDLRSSGAQVFVTQVSAINSSEVRGEQLLAQIEQIAATTGAGKVNLIGHSQGGADARYVMGVRPDLIASLTGVGAPHTPSAAADFLLDNLSGDGFSAAVFAVLGDAIGTVLDLLTGTPEPQDALASLRALTTASVTGFNQRFPAGLPATACGDGPAGNGNILLFSWTGSTIKTNPLDVSDAILGLTGGMDSGDSDGLADRCGSHFGSVLRDDYVMNHLDEINQVLGLTAITETSPVEVYRTHANRLKNAGL